MSVLCQLRTLLLCVYVYYVGVPSKTRDNSAPHFLWISKHQCRTAAVQNGGSGATPVNLATLMGSSFSTCDNPRTSSQNHIPTGNLVYVCTKCTFFFFHICMPCSAGRGSFLALSSEGCAGGPRVYHGTSVDPDRAPWRALWAFNSVDLARNHWIAFRPAESRRSWKPPECDVFVFRSATLSATSTTPTLKNVYHSDRKYHPRLAFDVNISNRCAYYRSEWSNSTQPRYNGSRASSFSLCDSHEQCFRVGVGVCVCAIEPSILQQAVGTTSM